MDSFAAPPPLATKRVIAAFDFDGTLSRGVSGIRFYRQLLGPWRSAWLAVRHLRAAICYNLRIDHEASLEVFNRYIFQGRRADDVIRAAEFFSNHTLPRSLLPAGMERLQAHLARGDRCVIISRGYEWCIAPWARSVGVHEVIATRLAVGPGGLLTGDMVEPSCDGENKRTHLLRLLGDRAQWEIHAYGDSAGDHAMFAVADHAFIRSGDAFVPWRQ